MFGLDIDTIIMIVYLFAMLCLGIYCARFIKGFDDFFVAGRRLGFWLSLGTLASIFVGGSAIAVAGMGHQYGVGGVWYYIAFSLGFFILAKTFVAPLRSLEQYTIADIFEARYSKKARVAVSFIIFVAWLFFFAALIVAGARVIEVTLGWNIITAIIVTAGVFTIYTSIGGMWAVTMTDFVQFLILVVGIIVMFPLALYHVGGFEGLFSALPTAYKGAVPEVDGSTMAGLGFLFATFMLTTPTTIVAPDVYLRVWCIKDDKSAKKTLYVLAVLLILFSAILVITGMAAYVIVPDAEHELALPLMMQTLLPAGLSGLMLVALLAAAVSGAVPEVIVCASILARDIYQSFINPNADDKKLLKVSRILTFFVGICGMALACSMTNVMDLTYYCYRIFVPATVPSIIAAFYSRKTTGAAALASIITGPVVVLLWLLVMPDSVMGFLDPVLPGLVASTLALIITNRFTKPTAEQEAFYDSVQAKLKSKKEAKKLADKA